MLTTRRCAPFRILLPLPSLSRQRGEQMLGIETIGWADHTDESVAASRSHGYPTVELHRALSRQGAQPAVVYPNVPLDGNECWRC